MAQSSITVKVDSEMKTQFEALCEQFGMSANPSALELYMQQRSVAELSKEQEITLDEINMEIRAAREDIRKRKSAKAFMR